MLCQSTYTTVQGLSTSSPLSQPLKTGLSAEFGSAGDANAYALDFVDGGVETLVLVQHLPLVCPPDFPEERCGIKVHLETEDKGFASEI